MERVSGTEVSPIYQAIPASLTDDELYVNLKAEDAEKDDAVTSTKLSDSWKNKNSTAKLLGYILPAAGKQLWLFAVHRNGQLPKCRH